MGLSRRRFTREFKLAAIQRLEQGISIAEVARALEAIMAGQVYEGQFVKVVRVDGTAPALDETTTRPETASVNSP